ncbi:MAG: sodium:alanine symporter family protein [Tissierella sp.]|nr:sodium:alanine symporter family protein [Tissierella sp.]
MDSFVNVVTAISDWLWGLPILTVLVVGSIFMAIRLKFFHFKYIGYIFKDTLGKMFSKEAKGEGTISPFQALTSALACAVGAGNIVGVSVAIFSGGPGAVFWMWFVALLGMALKYSEVVLALKYREKNDLGEFVGGPTYYISKGLNMKWLGIFFAFSLMLEVLPSTMVQANSVAAAAQEVFNINPMITGIISLIVVGIVVIGGIKRIGAFTEKFVPLMSILYVGGSIIIVLMNISKLPGVIGLIFGSAFTGTAAIGGFAGAAVSAAIRNGFARGLYSNEAGLGTAPIAHATATTDHPVRQGLWGIMEVFLDTVVICTATAFSILITGVWQSPNVTSGNNGTMTTMAFTEAFGQVGGAIVTISLVFFVISTLIVLIYYGEKQAEYLFGLKAAKFMKYIYVISIYVGAVGGAQVMWKFLDITLAMILVPNMIAVALLSKEVVELTNEYFNTKGKFYLKDIEHKTAKSN